MRLHPRVWKILRSRRTKILLACSPFILIALVALAFPVSNWLAYRAVDRLLKSISEAGYTTTAETYFSSPPPPEQNLFLHPAMLSEQEESAGIVKALRNFNPRLPGFSRRWGTGEPSLARQTDIRSWLKSPPADEKEAAGTLLAAIRPSSERFAELRIALKLPYAVYPVEGSLGTGWATAQTMVRSQFRLRSISEFAADEAYLLLAHGDSDRAAANVEAMLDCDRLYLSSKPTYVALILADALIGKTCDVIWEGVSRSAWTDSQLASLDLALARVDHQSAVAPAYRGETAFLNVWAEGVRAVKRPDQGVNFSKNWEADTKVVKGRLLGIWSELRPAGFTMLNMVKSQRTIFAELHFPDGSPRRRFEPEDLARFAKAKASYAELIIARDHGTWRGLDDDADGWAQLANMAARLLTAEARATLTRTGIALERHRLRHGSHPGALEELVPTYLPSIALDPFTRKPLHYRLQPDGSPLVWSIGANLTDEGGLPKRDRNQGHLIWITRPIPGYTEKEFRKP